MHTLAFGPCEILGRRRPRNFHRRVPLPRCRELLPSRNFHLGPAESAASPHNFHSSVCLITPRHLLENRALSRRGQDDHRKERTSPSPSSSSSSSSSPGCLRVRPLSKESLTIPNPFPKEDIAARSWAKIGNGIGTPGPGGSIAISRFRILRGERIRKCTFNH